MNDRKSLLLVMILLVLMCLKPIVAQELNGRNNRRIRVNPNNVFFNKDSIVLHPSANTYGINSGLSKPNSLLERISKEKLLSKITNERVEYFSSDADSLVFFGNHPFLLGVHKAYQEHRPIIISPDIIWTLVEQGFARYITLYSEKFRNRLVDFKGKKEINIVINKNDTQVDNSKSIWEIAIPQFSEQIEKITGKEYISHLRSDFTTTSSNSKLVSEVILMESVKSFFDYRMMFLGCGISSVTVEGDVSDWENIMKRLDYIETFDLQWWTKELRPIVQKIIDTKRGKVDKSFWSNIVQLQQREFYAPHETIDGWIIKFYPFNDKGERRNLDPIRDAKSIAAEFVKVPLILEYKELNRQFTMEILAGLFGMQQDSRNFSLKPAFGWAIVHQNKSISEVLPKQNSYDIVSFKNIKVIPETFFLLNKVNRLELSFLGKVDIPDRLSDVVIKYLDINGELDEVGVERLKTLLPNTLRIQVNGVVIQDKVTISTVDFMF